MKQLFVVLLGGKHPKARIEVHDIAFALGQQLSDTYPALRQHWFGKAEGLHIDSWMRVDGIDGFRLSFSNSLPAPDEHKLYLINLGGYLNTEFGEAHRYLLVCARDSKEAKQKGKQQFLSTWEKPHSDAVIDIDDCLPIDYVDGQHLHLIPDQHLPVHFENDYILLNQ